MHAQPAAQQHTDNTQTFSWQQYKISKVGDLATRACSRQGRSRRLCNAWACCVLHTSTLKKHNPASGTVAAMQRDASEAQLHSTTALHPGNACFLDR
jgi:hypothetical protein